MRKIPTHLQVPECIFRFRVLSYLERLLLAFLYAKNENERIFYFHIEDLSFIFGSSEIEIHKAINRLGDDCDRYLNYEFSIDIPKHEKGVGVIAKIEVDIKKIQNL